MAHKYAKIAFTDTVKLVQQQHNSRRGYEGMEHGDDVNFLLSQYEADFISQRDSFYMASVSETGWPYVQHRGGPEGFLRVIDENTIGFADYSGNRQYVSTGNFINNDRVSLILMDYVNKRRLKILGRVSRIEADDSENLAKVEIASFRAPVERGFLIHIEAFDWNCPKYITPRYNEQQLKALTDELQTQNKALKQQLDEKLSAEPKNLLQERSAKRLTEQDNSLISIDEINYLNIRAPLGEGPLRLIVTGIRQLTPKIRAYEFRSEQGEPLPKIAAGAHLQVPVKMADGKIQQRHYTICSNANRRDVYEIAVLKTGTANEIGQESGANALHQQYHLGQVIACPLPENHFALQNKLHQQGAPAVFIAGGIGITPIKAMMQSMQSQEFSFTGHYAGKSAQEMAFHDRLQREFNNQLSFYHSDKNQRLNIKAALREAADDAVFYFCGPNRLIDEILSIGKQLGISTNRLRFERFNHQVDKNAQALAVHLKRSKRTIRVPAKQSILDALIEADVGVAYSCKTGDCKACVVQVLEGEPQHLDTALSTIEREQQQLFCPCVSRASSQSITLDI